MAMGGGAGAGQVGAPTQVHQHGAVQQGSPKQHGHGGDHGPELIAPATGDPRFLDGTTGPVVKEGKAKTVTIPDGVGYGGQKGRKQNANDKKQNNYSVTDANFNPQLGLLAKDPDSGKPLNYVQGIQLYNAAGYIKTFAPDTWAKLVANQNAGKGTVLGAAGNLMGLIKTPDPALEGVDGADVPAQVPGSPIDARQYVMSAKDITGQQWARHHHPESAWDMYKSLVDAGLDWKNAMILAGDDGVSGSGRLNGYNNQDGSDSFNADEASVFKLGAQLQQQTGIPITQIMMSGHDHTGLDQSAKTKPRINKLLGLASGDVSASPERANAIANALLSGHEKIKTGKESKFVAKNKFLLGKDGAVAGASGSTTPKGGPVQQGPHQHGVGGATGSGAAAMQAMSGCGMTQPGPVQQAGAVPAAGGAAVAGAAGGADAMSAILAELRQMLESLSAIIARYSAAA